MRKQDKKRDPKGPKAFPRSQIKGVVEARKCKYCGHHENGVVTEAGDYLPLRPGMKIMVFLEED